MAEHRGKLAPGGPERREHVDPLVLLQKPRGPDGIAVEALGRLREIAEQATGLDTIEAHIEEQAVETLGRDGSECFGPIARTGEREGVGHEAPERFVVLEAILNDEHAGEHLPG